MKRLIYISFVVFFYAAQNASAQRIKYKDLVPLLETANDDQAIPMLNEFLLTERDNPNGNFRLGLLYARKYKSSDPLKEYEKAMEYANRAKLQMVKSKAVVDSREVSRNQEYYVTIAAQVNGSRVEFQTVQEQMDSEYQEATSFLQNLPPIYSSFTKAVASYDLAKKEYARLAEHYSSIKELLLLYDSNLEARLKSLQSHYDSALYYFDLYKEQKKLVKIPYDQNLSVQKITVYRKDGLATQTNFFAANIPIWDYKTWADDIFREVQSSIKDLRESLNQNEKRISESLLKVKEGSKTDNFISIDKQLIFDLGKYDYQTAIVPLLQYQEFQQQYIVRKNELTRFNKDTTISIQTRLAFYTELLYNNVKADSLLIDLTSKSQDTEKLRRHEEFLKKNFNGIDGVRKFTSGERDKMLTDYSNFVKDIRERLGEIEDNAEPEKRTVTYQKVSIPIFVNSEPPDSLLFNTYVTTAMEFNPDGSRYLSGVVIRNRKTNEIEIFVARLDAKEKINWLKYFNPEIDSLKSPANHYPSAIKPTQRGVLVAIHSESQDSAVVVNSLVYFSDTGEEIFASKMSQSSKAQFINYDENSRSFVITYYSTESTDLDIINVTDSGSVAWSKQLQFNGRINNVINIFDGVMFVGTGDYFKSPKGEMKSNEPGLVLFTISLDGNTMNERMVKGFKADKTIKVNDSNISLTASRSGGSMPAGATDFIITNAQLQLIYPRNN